MATSRIATVKIHPAIGIARLGNSPAAFFIGPEKPGVHRRPNGGYRDKQGRIKRQAARFRLFGYDKKGKLVGEITARDAQITWTVELANKKAAWRQFDGLNRNAPPRNPAVANRNSLKITPGERSLNGPNQVAMFDSGQFLGVVVPLGEIRTDQHNRLLVLGGFGKSASPANTKLTDEFANNDGWYDDISDGPVNATLTFKGKSKSLKAVGSWVICPPPDFAPAITNVITLYDTLYQIAVDKGWKKPPQKPSFMNDIYPILTRALSMRWVNQLKKMDEGNGPPAPPTNERGHEDAVWATIIPPPGSAKAREFVFNKLRDPSLAHDEDSPTDGDMPMLWSDYYTEGKSQPLTRVQYNNMKQWKEGHFFSDWGIPTASSGISPEGLDRSALEACVGAAFYPGIECSWLLRDVYPFMEPFRLDQKHVKPGDITKQMALPWQADFTDCAQDQQGDLNLGWWPGQRPDDVYPETGGPQVPWTRGLVNNMTDMVKKWHRLGFVIKRGSRYVETERKS
jgi:hypothetical protein